MHWILNQWTEESGGGSRTRQGSTDPRNLSPNTPQGAAEIWNIEPQLKQFMLR